MRIAIVNDTTFQEICRCISLKGNDIRFRWNLDWKFDRWVNIDLLSKIVNKDKTTLNSATFSIIADKFLDSGRMDLKDFLLGTIENKKRKYCPCCLMSSSTYSLLWQVRDISMCEIHNVELVSSCQKCDKVLPYVHESLGQGQCPFCNKKLGQNVQKITSNPIEIKKQITHYTNWRFLIDSNNPIISKGEFSRGRQLASMLIYIVHDRKEHFYHEKTTLLTNDYVSRLLKYIKEGEKTTEKTYRVTLRLLFQVLNSKDMMMEEFINIRLPKNYNKNIEGYSRVGPCIAPWCTSYLKLDRLKPLEFSNNAKRFQGQLYRYPHLCLDCGLLFGMNKYGQWCEAGEMISIAYEKIAPMINAGYIRIEIKDLLGLTRFMVNKMFAFLLRYKLLNNELLDMYKSSFTIENPISYFQALGDLNGAKISEARKMFGWSQLEYYYYFSDPRIQELMYLEMVSVDIGAKSEDVSSDSVNIRKPYSIPRIVSVEEEGILWKRAKHYVISRLNERLELTEISYFEYLGRGKKWLKNSAPELIEWFHNQKQIVIEQLLQQTILERQEKVLRTIISLYKLGFKISIQKIEEHSNITKKYMRIHGVIPFIKQIRDSLINGEVTIERLEGALNSVGAGNRLLHLIDEKLLN